MRPVFYSTEDCIACYYIEQARRSGPGSIPLDPLPSTPEASEASRERWTVAIRAFGALAKVRHSRDRRQLAQRNTAVDCALWVAGNGGLTLEEVGTIMGVTRERVRQIQDKAIKKIKRFLRQTDNRDLVAALREGFEELKG